MRVIFIVSILFLTYAAHTQNLPGLNTPKRGIYLTFEEFVNNSPTGGSQFIVQEETEITLASSRSTSDNTVDAYQRPLTIYRLKDVNGKNLKGYLKFWGFSDGYSIYVNSTTHKKADHFVKLQLIGPICYFSQLGNNSGLQELKYYDRGDPRQSQPTYQPTLYYLSQYVMNLSTGEIEELSKKKLEEIVAPYSDLLAKARILHKRDIFADLIQQYNMREGMKGK